MPTEAAEVAAPIWKLCPTYLDASTPDDRKAALMLLTKATLDGGAPVTTLKNGPGCLSRTAK